VLLRVPAAAISSSGLSVLRGAKMGEAANLARTLQNEPANVATPSWVAAEATKTARAAKKSRLSIRVLGRSELHKLKMNAMLAVASGSAQEPKLVVLQYRGAAHKGWDAAIVGKGVTFDSGGISIKPSSKMDEMKFDKSGACAIIGIMSGCASLALPLNVVGVAALVENMPGGHAYRPGDILTACNGTTIEVLNTDAEGRVVLADALAYASKAYSPAVMVDLATLTGACAVALGDLASGILSENDELVDELVAAGERCGERLWRLPLWPEYDDKVKSEVASVKNIGEPGVAGVTAGASFLKPFAGERPWAHLDIAGTAYGAKPRGGLSAGGYGLGVRLVLEYLSEYRAPKKKSSRN
jgi:leucyl aminopeptidase